MSMSLQILAADAGLAGGQLLHEEQTLNKGESLIYRGGTQTKKLQNRRAKFETKVNLSEKESIEAMSPNM